MPLQPPTLRDDGLFNITVGKWAEKKYKLLRYYAELFSSSMQAKWDARVYIDLFAGSGRGRMKRTQKIVPTSALLAIDIPARFDKYIFCELRNERIDALEERVKRDFPQAIAEFIAGDTNLNVGSIVAAIPSPSKQFTVLSFCFVDPYRLEDIQFTTIEGISKMLVDFLVLIPAYMDAHRNLPRYLDPSSRKVQRFTGNPKWRQSWDKVRTSGIGFGSFVADEFGNQMSKLGYSYGGLDETVLIRNPERNQPLYRLAFFSRHGLATDFWNQAKKYTQQQLRLPGF